ncbi:MAG: AAA family ATPase [Treponema sp.]|nr:AAA family ATPase [Treponema sp.]
MKTRVNTDYLINLLEVTPASQNIMLVGKHGIGKSQILEQFYTERGCKVVTLFLGQMSDPGDLIGIPRKNEATGKTEFLPPYWFPTDNTPVVLFLDELNRARPEVLQTIMDLALNRRLAGKALPPGSRIISAVNNGDEYQLTELDPALVSRFNIYEFIPGVDEWLVWANKKNLDERIIRFIDLNKGELDGEEYTGSDDDLEKTPDRRAWERASDIIKGTEELTQFHKTVIAGIVGQKSAVRFLEFLNKNKIIPAEELLLGNFDQTKERLKAYTTPEFAVINDSIFPFLEKTIAKADTQAVLLISKNLGHYYDFLEKKNLREALAHFASLFKSNSYPNALAFMVSDCENLFSKATRFVASLK